jgi:hypothetical protein
MGKLITINEITQDELDTLKRIDTNCHRMHTFAPPKVFIDLNVFNSDGEHVLEYKKLSKTWVRNAYNVLAMQTMGLPSNINGTTFEAGKLTCKSVSGSLYYSTKPSWIGNGGWGSNDVGGYGSTSGAGNTTMGIVVGTGNSAESFEDYKLGTLIAHGTGAGQLSYQAMGGATPTYNAGTKVFTAVHMRYIDNNSGNTITVKETGFIYGLAYGDYPYRNYFLMSRDLLASPVDVATGQRLAVTYTFSITYPS